MVFEPCAGAVPISEQVLARQEQLKGQQCQGARAGGRLRVIFGARPRRPPEEYDDRDGNTGQGLFMHEGYGLPDRETERLCRLIFCQRRNPPTNASALLPALHPDGSRNSRTIWRPHQRTACS